MCFTGIRIHRLDFRIPLLETFRTILRILSLERVRRILWRSITQKGKCPHLSGSDGCDICTEPSQTVHRLPPFRFHEKTIVYALFAILIFDILLPILTEKYRSTIRIRLWTQLHHFPIFTSDDQQDRKPLWISGNCKLGSRSLERDHRRIVNGFVVCFILTALYRPSLMPCNQAPRGSIPGDFYRREYWPGLWGWCKPYIVGIDRKTKPDLCYRFLSSM